MPLIKIVENGEVIVGQEKLSKAYARRGGEELRLLTERDVKDKVEGMGEVWLQIQENIKKFPSPADYWLEEGKEEALHACFRLGCGGITVEVDESGKLKTNSSEE